MKLIVGLGNPDSHYQKTRHNIGRRAVELLAVRHKAEWKKNPSLHARTAEVIQSDITLLFAIPEVYMNESGKAVGLLVRHFKIDPKNDLLVVGDEAALPFGKLRLRASGQDAGHRGLRSVEQVLASQDYARLRIGIAPSEPVEEPLEKYVLNPFSTLEEKALPEILERAVESCLLWVSGPIQKAMDWTNKPSQ